MKILIAKALSFFLLVFLFAFSAQAQKKSKFDYLVSIETTYGNIDLLLFDATPSHKANFLKLARSGFYDSCTFHKVLNGFMIQGGDPESKPGGNAERIGQGSPGYSLPSEIRSGLQHNRGMVGAARQNDELNPEKRSSGAQFYIIQAENGAHHLDGDYTLFGKVLAGMQAVDSIASQPVNSQGFPTTPIFFSVKVQEMKRKAIEKNFGYSY